MTIRSGEYDTAGVWDGTYWDWCSRWIPLTITLVDPDLKEEVECPSGCRVPSYKFEIEDTVTEQVDVIASKGPDDCVASSHIKDANVNRNVESQTDGFAINFTDARAVSPRLVNDLSANPVRQDIRKRIRVTVGFVFPDKTVTVRIFTGLPLVRREDWDDKGSKMTISGFSLSYLLQLDPGTTEDYVGSRSGLVMDLATAAGFDSLVMGFDDTMLGLGDPVSIIANTTEEALGSLFAADREFEWYVDAYGTLFFRKPDSGEVVFAYATGKNIKKISTSNDITQVITEANVIGGNEAGTLVVPDLGSQDRIGRRSSSVSSSTIEDAATANEAGLAEINKSKRALKKMSLGVIANPYLEPFMVLSVDGTSVSSGYDGNITVLQLTHRITPDGIQGTLSGEFDEEV